MIRNKIITAIILSIIALSCLQQSVLAAGKADRRRHINPCAATPTYCVTPEGVVINIAPEVTDWTTAQIYDLLKRNSYQLSLIGPTLTIKVQTQSPSSFAGSAGTSYNVWTNFRGVIYLRPSFTNADGTWNTQTFSIRPDFVMAHEYGHAWTTYHLYLTQQKNWTPWLETRGLVGDSRLDTSYAWSKSEMIADDYRLLFGSPEAIAAASYMNRDISDPRTIDGYKDWFINVWAGGGI